MSRASAHKKGSNQLHAGDYAGAVKTLRDCVKDFGPHVGPLSDLVFAAYLGEDMGAFNLAVEQLEAEFEKALPKLSKEAEAFTRVALSKAFELQGRIAEAFEEIDQLIAQLPKGKGDHLLIQIKCQKLRLLASFGREKELNDLYRQCLGISESSPQQLAECFHALMIAEARLFGLSATWPRFLHLTLTPGLHEADVRLCLIDLLEVALDHHDLAAQASILAFIESEKISGFDRYENAVLRMAEDPETMLSPAEIFAWKRFMPYFSLVRLLALEIKRGSADAELKKKLLFLYQALDHRSRRVLKNWLPPLEEAASLMLDAKAKTLRAGTASLSFAKSPQSWAILEILVKEGQISPPDMLARLDRKDTSQNTESLRISVLRLNKKLAAFAHADWAIRFGKEKIELNPALRS
jgi:tetratricopeptide (TPR) repeat protein